MDTSDVYRISYPPFQTASEDEYISVVKHLSSFKIDGGAEDKQLLQRLIKYLNPHMLIDPETGVPYLKTSGRRLKTPVTQLITYFFPISFAAEMPISGKPIDANLFIKFLKEIKLPAHFMRMVVKNVNILPQE